MFYLDLKQENITEDAYEKAKYLYMALKMRNIFDLNYLYIYQDVSILSKILENKCEMMNRTYRFNPRLCNFVSKLSWWLRQVKIKNCNCHANQRGNSSAKQKSTNVQILLY